MNSFLGFILLLFGGLGGWLGWRRGTKHVYSRPIINEDVPDGMTRYEHERAIRRRRKLWRLAVTAGYAVLGMIVDLLILMAMKRSR